MKKLLLVMMLFVSSELFALDGSVGSINFSGNGNVTVPIIGTSVTKSYQLLGSAEVKKTMIAVILTAKAGQMDITAYPGVIDGKFGWTNIILK